MWRKRSSQACWGTKMSVSVDVDVLDDLITHLNAWRRTNTVRTLVPPLVSRET